MIAATSEYVWRTIEAGIRMGQTWPAAFYLFSHSPSFTDDAIVTMVKSDGRARSAPDAVAHDRQLADDGDATA